MINIQFAALFDEKRYKSLCFNVNKFDLKCVAWKHQQKRKNKLNQVEQIMYEWTH